MSVSIHIAVVMLSGSISPGPYVRRCSESSLHLGAVPEVGQDRSDAEPGMISNCSRNRRIEIAPSELVVISPDSSIVR
ncbi:hypothetical protein GCM10017691_18790 [Pseudonocardia petroleophila]